MKQKFHLLITTKTSGFLWYIIDNLSCKLDGFAQVYENSIGREYSKEYAQLRLSATKKVLHIGCGSYPLTNIILSADGLQHIVGIDSDPRAVELAQHIISKKHLSEQVTIEQSDGQHYSVKKFDIIIISSCSWPKMDIVDHVLTDAKKNSIIILRELNHVVKPVKQCILSHPDIVILKHISHHPFPFYGPIGWQSFYLTKK